MNKIIRVLLLLIVGTGLLLGHAGCSAQARKNRHLARAAKYYAAGDRDKAEIEYINVLESDEFNPDAIAGLGMIYQDQGRIGKVFTFFAKAKELRPDNTEVRARLGQVYLAAGRLKDARDEAVFVLEHDPKQADAPLVLAMSSVTKSDLEDAQARLTKLPTAKMSPALTALGVVQARMRDIPSAQQRFTEAIAADAKDPMPHLWLGILRREQNDRAHAETEFATASKLAPAQSNIRIQYAQFEAQTGHMDVARQVLEEVIAKAPDCFPAYLSLAELSLAEKKTDDAIALIAKVIARDSTQPDAITLAARARIAKGEPQKAITELERGVTVYPKSGPMMYQLGLAYVAIGDLNHASATFARTLLLEPDYPLASLMLADVQMRQDNPAAAAATLKAVVQKHPELLQAWLALGTALTRCGDLEGALGVYRQLLATSPSDPQANLFVGLTLVRQNKRAEAYKAFEHTLTIAPGYLPALEQLVDLDLRERKYPLALARLKTERTRNPQEKATLLLVAKVYVAQNDFPNAEATLKEVIAAQPDQVIPYVMLAKLYINSKHETEAVANLQVAVKNNPNAVEPLMLLAVLQDQRKEYPSARDAYEALVALNPRFGAAWNNLAYLYSERLNALEKAFQAAQKARELMPNDPYTADTLGWVVYKRHDYSWALSLLTESAEKLPESSDVALHLGMTRYALGDEEGARATLQNALKRDSQPESAELGRRALAMLDFNPATASQADITKMEAQAKAENDPVLMTRAGSWYQQHGQNARATELFNAALKLSPNNVKATIGLCQVFRADKQTARALELAKAARKIAPNNAEVAQITGELAFESGDYAWASSVLHDAVRSRPTDAAIQFAYARASYATGDLDAAEAGLRQAIDNGLAGPQLDAARRYTRFIGATKTPQASDVAAAQDALAADPSFVPALMVLGANQEQKHDDAAAESTYTRALQQYPDFVPAKKRLVILYANRSGDVPATAASLAVKVRGALPDDVEVLKACGIIAYRSGDFAQASSLLRESTRTRKDDPESLYYFGMSQFRLNRKAESKELLQAFIAANVRPDLVAEARAALEKLR